MTRSSTAFACPAYRNYDGEARRRHVVGPASPSRHPGINFVLNTIVPGAGGEQHVGAEPWVAEHFPRHGHARLHRRARHLKFNGLDRRLRGAACPKEITYEGVDASTTSKSASTHRPRTA